MVVVVVVHPRNKSEVWVEPIKNQGLEERAGIVQVLAKAEHLEQSSCNQVPAGLHPSSSLNEQHKQGPGGGEVAADEVCQAGGS